MKESFKGLCNLNEDELKALLENSKTSIVIDTEVLLMLFQMEEKNSSELLDILESEWLSDKLWMPHDVGFSFMCNVNSYIVRERQLINNARKQLENFHDNVINMKSNPYLKDDVLANFKDTFDKIKTSFDSDINALDLELEKNTKKERIDKIFTQDKVGVNYTDAQLSETAALLGYGGSAGFSIPVSIKTMESSMPYECAGMVFLLMLLYSLFIATLMLWLNLTFKGAVGVIGAFAVNIYGFLLNPEILKKIFHFSENLEYKANVLCGWLSPINHATFSMHNFGYDYLPQIKVSIIIFLICIIGFTLILLILLIQLHSP